MSQTRAALVSGANRGIGLEIARQLARLGYLTAIGARDTAKGQAAADELRNEGLELPVIALDVDDPASCAKAVDEVVGMFGRLDVLVNNAAFFSRSLRQANRARSSSGPKPSVRRSRPMSSVHSR